MVMYADHDHRGEYASDNHDHYDYAEKHHRHYDDESTVRGLREDLGHAEERIRQLENDLHDAFERIRALEGQTPQAQRLQLEADLAAADLAASGYDRHGRDCQCSYCGTDGPDPDRPETWVFGEAPEPAGWHDVPDPEESQP